MRYAALLILVGSISSCNQKSRPITIYTGEWSPYVMTTPYGDAPSVCGAYGESAEIVAAVLREMNYEPRFEFRPWSMIDARIRAGRVKGAFPYMKAADRMDSYSFSKPIGQASEILFYDTRRRHPAENEADYAQWCLGYIKGYEFSEKTKRVFPKRVALTASEEVVFTHLFDGTEINGATIDAFVCSERVGRKLVAERLPDAYERLGVLEDFRVKNQLHFVVPKRGDGRPGFIREFDESLARLEENGTIGEIRARHVRLRRTLERRHGREAVLRGIAGHPVVYGSLQAPGSAGAKGGVVIPQETRVSVLEWGREFTQPLLVRTEDAFRSFTRVRVLEGPLSGSEVWVASPFVHMR